MCIVLKGISSVLLQTEAVSDFKAFSDFRMLENAGLVCRRDDLSYATSIFHFVAGYECICNQMKFKSNYHQPHH